MKGLVKYFVAFSLTLLLYKCANQQYPSGGPKDSVPPEILSVYPENGTLNFPDIFFEIDFSEYVEKTSLTDALFISPEIKNLDYDWSGTSVRITFDDTLSVNTTYTLSIGSSIKDLNNQNPMLKATNISFSTGNKIDIGEITGKVFDSDLTGTMVYAYLKADTFANPISIKPQNITQVGENGEFKLLGLKNGLYRLFAVKDESGNRLYNIGEDKYGVASEVIQITDSVNSISGIQFKLTIEDTIAPFISNVTMTDNHHLAVEYSELLDSSKITVNNFYVVDSTSGVNRTIKYLYQGNKQKFKYILAIADTLSSAGKYSLVAKNISDKYSNVTKYESYEFVVNEKPDTLIPSIKNIVTPYEKKKTDFINAEFTINLNDGVGYENLKTALVMDKHKWHLTKNDNATFKVEITDKLEPNTKVEFEINRKLIPDAAGNSLDSVETFSLETLSGREFSGLSGSVDMHDATANLRVVINNIESKMNYSTKVDSNKNYSFKRILPGKYTVWMFDDANRDEEYNYGKVIPFEASEKFVVYPDTINLRPRWPVGDYKLEVR